MSSSCDSECHHLATRNVIILRLGPQTGLSLQLANQWNAVRLESLADPKVTLKLGDLTQVVRFSLYHGKEIGGTLVIETRRVEIAAVALLIEEGIVSIPE